MLVEYLGVTRGFLLAGLMEILPDRCTSIAKKELVYAGTVGIVCWLGGIIFINRKKTDTAKSVMAGAAQTMLDKQVGAPPSPGPSWERLPDLTFDPLA